MTRDEDLSDCARHSTQQRKEVLTLALEGWEWASCASKSRSWRLQRLLRSTKTPKSTAAGPPRSTEPYNPTSQHSNVLGLRDVTILIVRRCL